MSRRFVKVNSSSFRAGMFLLETLTAGMYNDPLSIYREYIQNAVDSLDLHEDMQNKDDLKVDINLDPLEQSITIRDNGVGIPGSIAESILSSVGSSNKTGTGARGFRGIGRLGGVAFSDKAIFRTKASCDDFESVQEWDCRRLRELLSDHRKSNLTLNEVFQEVTRFNRVNSKKPGNSYFEVTLNGVSSFRNLIMDISKVRDYLSQVAPVSFNSQDFSYHKEINTYLMKNLHNYGKYSLILNGDPIFKPYQDNVRLTKSGYDKIEKVECFEINIENKPIAYCWLGHRRELLGGIAKGNHSSGIRVRIGNLLLGDAHLLDRCFREPRFNSYCVGEIHVDCSELIPNSRRDDFVDNEMKTLFFDAVEKRIGLPLSKEIRRRSRIASDSVIESQNSVTRISFDDNSTLSVNNMCKANEGLYTQRIMNVINSKCVNCPTAKELLQAFDDTTLKRFELLNK